MEKKKSIQDWLKQLRENKAGTIEVDAMRHGVTIGSIAAILSKQLNAYFDDHKIDYMVTSRRHLVRFLTTRGVDDKGGGPLVKKSVRNWLRSYGIETRHDGGFVIFKRIERKKKIIK